MSSIVEFIRKQYVWIGVAILVTFILRDVRIGLGIRHVQNDCNEACWLTGATSSRLIGENHVCVCGRFNKRYRPVEKRPNPTLLAGTR